MAWYALGKDCVRGLNHRISATRRSADELREVCLHYTGEEGRGEDAECIVGARVLHGHEERGSATKKINTKIQKQRMC